MEHVRRMVIVTGASRGIGRATTLSLLNDHGCRVLAISRDQAALNTIASECEGGHGILEVMTLDITEQTAPARVKERVGERRVHALINNAGLLIKRPFADWSEEDLMRVFRTNVFAPFRMTQVLARLLQGDPPGHVVNIGSMGGFQGSMKFPGLIAYSTSKAALANLTECMAAEISSGLHFNCLCIGAVDTEMLREAFPGYAAPLGSENMGRYVARFALEGQKVFSGKVLPVSLSTP